MAAPRCKFQVLPLNRENQEPEPTSHQSYRRESVELRTTRTTRKRNRWIVMRCDLRLRFHHDFFGDPSDSASVLAFGLVDIVLLESMSRGRPIMFRWKMKYKRESSVAAKRFFVTKRGVASRAEGRV